MKIISKAKVRDDQLVDSPLSKENQAATPKFERYNKKSQNLDFILPRSRIGTSNLLKSSMKRFLRRL